MTIDLRYMRLGTSSEFNAENRVLALGQPAYEIDTARLKVGDGISKYMTLSFFTDTTSGTYRGPVANEGAMLAIAAGFIGDKVTRTDANGQIFELIALPASLIGNWLAYPLSGPGGDIDGGTPEVGTVFDYDGGTP